MASWQNSLEDHEKHLLGNLLDDESILGSPPRTGGLFSNGTPPSNESSVVDGVGPIGPSHMQNFWPEPPPPYTPAVQGFDWTNVSSSNVTGGDPHSACFGVSDFFKTGLKEPSEWSSLLKGVGSCGEFSFTESPFSSASGVHFHQHNMHHHTHVHNVIEHRRHEHGGVNTSPVLANATLVPKSLNNILQNTQERDIPVQSAPHSAPVITKMPFSYRDVAARHDSSSGPSQNMTKKSTSTSEVIPKPSEDNDNISSNPKQEHPVDKIIEKKQCRSQDGLIERAKSDEFQKISTKGKKPKKISTVAAIDITRNQKPVVTKYQILEKLSSPKIMRTECLESDEVFESENDPIANDRGFATNNDISSEEQRHRKDQNVTLAKRKTNSTSVVAAQKKRPCRKKNHQNWLFNVAVIFLMYMCDTFCDGLKWLMTLIVDVCSQMCDITLYGFCSMWDYAMEWLRSVFLSLMNILSYCMSWIKDFDILWIWFGPLTHKLGLDDVQPLPATTDELLDRLSQLSRVDAYCILGLTSDCSEKDIRDHAHHLLSVLAFDKTFTEGVEDSVDLVTRAYAAIGTPLNRQNYTVATIRDSVAQKEIMLQWDAVRERTLSMRNRMYCECGRRHLRVPLDRRLSNARYCRRCNTYHSARHNDIWVESSLWGLVYIYFTCTDGIIYDITEWATCEMNYLKHMRPNAHNVQYRLVSPSVGDRSQGSRSSHKDLTDALDTESSSRNGAQVSFRPPEVRGEDRSRRAANRRQKRR